MQSPLNYLLNSPVFSSIRVAGLTTLNRILLRRNLVISPSENVPARAAARDLIANTRRETAMVLIDAEAYNIYSAAERSLKVPGDIAEVGVFRGGSARLMCAVKGNRSLHLFDTFSGLPEAGEYDSKFRKGGFAASLEDVQKYLATFPDVYFHKGLFPDTASGLENIRFSFVHLDVDLYQSTLASLEWFYPRLNRGAMLISHDYDAEGVRRAFDEFFVEKPEFVIELSTTQAAFVKV
ncbi:MAG TPA: TylF/MycF/NovP-related O-methyltransferase [Bryobacteraceae bacterium]|nr:TylF/MycF/NovP-related O-methyltransferase [Bryobacteraceae bacterium]